jgi:tyrosyl-tRNA synthetase
MIEQGAVRIEGEKINDVNLLIKVGQKFILKVGKRKFLSVK